MLKLKFDSFLIYNTLDCIIEDASCSETQCEQIELSKIMTTSRKSSCLRAIRKTVNKMRFLVSCRFLMVVVTLLVLCFALRKVLLLHRSAPVVSSRLTWSAKPHGHKWRHLPVHIVEEHHEGRILLSENMHAYSLSLFCKLTSLIHIRVA